MIDDEKDQPEEETQAEDSEEGVGLEAMAPNDLGEPRDEEDLPPAEETKTPYDEA